MKSGRLEFDYKELMEYLESCMPMEMKHGYYACMEAVEQFFLDKLQLKVVK